MRRALTIAAIVIVLLGLAIGGYFWWEGRQAASLTVGTGTVNNPFGDTGTGAAGGGADTGSSTTQNAIGSPVQTGSHLTEVAAGPAAAGLSMARVVIPAASSTGTTSVSTTDTELRYVERKSGNIYAYRVHSGALTRLSNRTIPGAAEASWLADGSVAFLRFVTIDAGGNQTVNTYALPASGTGGYALAQNLAQATAVGSSSVLTLVSGANGTTATLASASGSSQKTAFTTPLSQIKSFYTKAGIVSETLPSALMPGYAFTLDKNGNFVRVAGPLNGLSILPNHAGTAALVSYLDGSTLKLAELTFATQALTPLPVSTLAEKCVWTADDSSAYCGVPVALPSGTLPDDWYQGAVSFQDRIWQIDFDGRVAELVANLPALAKEPIDATSLTIDPSGDALGFVNRQDGSVWVYDL
jgi:hypothetical protein